MYFNQKYKWNLDVKTYIENFGIHPYFQVSPNPNICFYFDENESFSNMKHGFVFKIYQEM